MSELDVSQLDVIHARLAILERYVARLFADQLSRHPDPLAELEAIDRRWQARLDGAEERSRARIAALENPGAPEDYEAVLANELGLSDARHALFLAEVRALLGSA